MAPPNRERMEDCTVEEARRLYHDRYRVFWAMPEWQWMHANYPCYPMFDDHELIDNWGSDPKHQEPEWRRIGEGARWAYDNYQALRVRERTEGLPESFDYQIKYRPMAVYVLDLRSNRKAGDNGSLISETQHQSLERFLSEHRTCPIVGIVLTVPVVHLPRGVARFAARITGIIPVYRLIS